MTDPTTDRLTLLHAWTAQQDRARRTYHRETKCAHCGRWTSRAYCDQTCRKQQERLAKESK